MPVHRNKSAQKNTTPMVAKLDESVEIRPESPDVNLEIGLDISVVRNRKCQTPATQRHKAARFALFESPGI